LIVVAEGRDLFLADQQVAGEMLRAAGKMTQTGRPLQCRETLTGAEVRAGQVAKR
jgi:hypothetical protein